MALLLLQEYNQLDIIEPHVLEMIANLQAEMNQVMGFFISDALILLGIMMLFYLGKKAYDLMTGDNKLTLLPLLRPFIFFLIVANWSAFVVGINAPLVALENVAKTQFDNKRIQVNQEYAVFHQQREELTLAFFGATQTADNDVGLSDLFFALPLVPDWREDRRSILEKISLKLYMIFQKGEMILQRVMLTITVQIYKAAIYFLFYLQIFLKALLILIGPLIFALSVVEAYRDLYLQWISKFVSVGFYVLFAYIAMLLSFVLLTMFLKIENKWMADQLIRYNAGVENPESTLTFIRIMVNAWGGGAGSILTALTVGILGLLSVPLVSTWILGANATTTLTNQIGKNAATLMK